MSDPRQPEARGQQERGAVERLELNRETIRDLTEMQGDPRMMAGIAPPTRPPYCRGLDEAQQGMMAGIIPNTRFPQCR